MLGNVGMMTNRQFMASHEPVHPRIAYLEFTNTRCINHVSCLESQHQHWYGMPLCLLLLNPGDDSILKLWPLSSLTSLSFFSWHLLQSWLRCLPALNTGLSYAELPPSLKVTKLLHTDKWRVWMKQWRNVLTSWILDLGLDDWTRVERMIYTLIYPQLFFFFYVTDMTQAKPAPIFFFLQ